MAKRARHGREHWENLIAEFESDGGRERHSAFAARHRLRLATFRRWLYRLREQPAIRTPSVRVLPVTVVGGEARRDEVLVDCNGVHLRFATGTDPIYVAALVTALRAC